MIFWGGMGGAFEFVTKSSHAVARLKEGNFPGKHTNAFMSMWAIWASSARVPAGRPLANDNVWGLGEDVVGWVFFFFAASPNNFPHNAD